VGSAVGATVGSAVADGLDGSKTFTK
jgi:hypothetical protein